MKKAINLALLAANLIAVYFYLRFASLAWAIPEETTAGLHPAIAGPAMVWGLSALPILLVFWVIDGGWCYAVVSRRLMKWPIWVACLVWTCAVIVDFMHH